MVMMIVVIMMVILVMTWHDPVYQDIYQRWPDAVTNTWIGPRQEDGDAEAFIEVFTVMEFGVDVHALLFDPLGDAHTVVPVA